MKIKITPYDPAWPQQFDLEKTAIASAFSHFAPAIEHIGSTSVPQLSAKPVIDILVGLKNETDLDQVIAPMMERGYTYFKIYEPGMPYRRLFVKMNALTGKPIPAMIDVGETFVNGQDFATTVHIHILLKGAFHWDRHIAFRDYLRTHPAERNEYQQLKLELAKLDFKDHLEYNAGKESFIKKTQTAALEWWQEQKK